MVSSLPIPWQACWVLRMGWWWQGPFQRTFEQGPPQMSPRKANQRLLLEFILVLGCQGLKHKPRRAKTRAWPSGDSRALSAPGCQWGVDRLLVWIHPVLLRTASWLLSWLEADVTFQLQQECGEGRLRGTGKVSGARLALCALAAGLRFCQGQGWWELPGSSEGSEFVIWVPQLPLSIYPSIYGSLRRNFLLKALLCTPGGLTGQWGTRWENSQWENTSLALMCVISVVLLLVRNCSEETYVNSKTEESWFISYYSVIGDF